MATWTPRTRDRSRVTTAGSSGPTWETVGCPERTTNRGDPVAKPDVTIPDAPPPAELVVEDLEIGEGEAARAGQQVTVHYGGVAWWTGSQFDASWDRGEPFEFGLGRGQVID